MGGATCSQITWKLLKFCLQVKKKNQFLLFLLDNLLQRECEGQWFAEDAPVLCPRWEKRLEIDLEFDQILSKPTPYKRGQ